MRYFFDTSALVSAWLEDDKDHEWAYNQYTNAQESRGAGFGNSGVIVSSILKYELSKAFTYQKNPRIASSTQIVEIESCDQIDVTADTLLAAAELMKSHNLQSLDAIQLACAVEAKRKYMEEVVFVTKDKKLGNVAQKIGLVLAFP